MNDGTLVSDVPAPAWDGGQPPTITYVLPLVDFQSAAANATPMPLSKNGQPLTATILECPAGACVSPDGGSMTPVVTLPPKGGGEIYDIALTYGFTGAILINPSGYTIGPDGFMGQPDPQGYIPILYFFGGPLYGTPGPNGPSPSVMGVAIAIPTYYWLDHLFSEVIATRDATKAILVVRILDCNGNRASGVTLSVTPSSGPQATGFTLGQDYEAEQSPVAVGQPPPPTDSHGVAGYFNMNPGNYTVSAVTMDGAKYVTNTPAHMLQGIVTEVELRTDVALNYGR
jgi:hypothetical protein